MVNSPPLHKRSSDNEFRDVLGGGLANARRNMVTVGTVLACGQPAGARHPGLPVQHVRSRADQPQHGHAGDADHHRDRRDRGACADGHDAPHHPDADCGRNRGTIGRTGPERRRQGRAERIQPRIPDTGGPAASALVHYRSGVADDVRYAGGAGLFRRGVPDPSASRIHRAGVRRRAGHRGAAEPAGHRGSVQPGQQLRRQGKPDGGIDGPQCPGHQCDGHDPGRRPGMGPRNRGVPEGAGDRTGSQHPDDGVVEVPAAVHPDRHPGLGRMAGAGSSD